MTEAVFSGATGTLRTLVDGTVRLVIDFEPRDAGPVMTALGQPGTPVAVARLTQQAATEAVLKVQAGQDRAQYGEEAKSLRLSGFFRAPEVWRHVGTDAEFLAWLKTQKCCVKHPGHEGDIVPAHVRRVKHGAGTGIKPEYSAVPMCARHHQLQHDNAECAVGGKEFLDRERVKHLEQWAWETLKGHLGYAHWNEVPPATVREWAEAHDVVKYLPREIREAA